MTSGLPTVAFRICFYIADLTKASMIGAIDMAFLVLLGDESLPQTCGCVHNGRTIKPF